MPRHRSSLTLHETGQATSGRHLAAEQVQQLLETRPALHSHQQYGECGAEVKQETTPDLRRSTTVEVYECAKRMAKFDRAIRLYYY